MSNLDFRCISILLEEEYGGKDLYQEEIDFFENLFKKKKESIFFITSDDCENNVITTLLDESVFKKLFISGKCLYEHEDIEFVYEYVDGGLEVVTFLKEDCLKLFNEKIK